MKNNQVTKPVLEFKMAQGNLIRLWVINPGQYVKLSEQRSMQFPHNPSDKTASLIYETISTGGHEAIEYPLDKKSIWDWIHNWMEAGYKVNGLL